MLSKSNSVVLACIALYMIAAVLRLVQDGFIKIETSLISTDVVITNRQGQRVGRFAREDFGVHEGGERQESTHVTPDNRKLRMVLILDASVGIEPSFPTVKEAIGLFRDLESDD